MLKKGLILINLGTPDSCAVKDVRRYLAQFLSDPRVIDIPAVFRYLILSLILITRPKKSAKAYAKIWQDDGSPLMTNTLDLASKVRTNLGENWHVETAMRYANPSVSSVIKKMQAAKVEKIYVLPLFPQYASSSYGSALAAIYKELNKHDYVMPVNVKEPYYSCPEFIDVLAESTKEELLDFDHMLMSFHGLPEKHVLKSDGGKNAPGCDLKQACPKITKSNMSCYRAQCYATAALLAKKLGISNYSVGFQSRLGPNPWIKPYTDEVIKELFEQGHRKLVLVCPSFTSDCLETLEEIGMELRKEWLELGGESFQMISCLNANDKWAKLISKWASQGG